MRNNRSEGRPSEKIQAMVNGRWDLVFAQLAPELSEAMEAAPAGRKAAHVACPVHGGTDGFRFFNDWREVGGGICNSCGTVGNGIAMLAWLREVSYKDAMKLLFTLLEDKEMPRLPKVDREKIRRANVDADRKAVYAVRRLWAGSFLLAAPVAEPARMYFARRGLRVPASDAIRFSLRTLHVERVKDDDGGVTCRRTFWPAILLRVSDSHGRPVTIHRTYITPDGYKAPVDDVKKMMPYPEHYLSVTGAAVRLSAWVPEVLGVAEGLETALAVTEATGMMTWPCLSASFLETFVVPAGVGQLVIWADGDRNGRGREAAVALCKRSWQQGVRASAITPSIDIDFGQKSVDWLDVLNRLGPDGFVRSLDRSPKGVAVMR